MLHFSILRNIINGRGLLESADKCKGNDKYERKIIPCEMFYVVSVHISGEILEYWKVWDNTVLMEIKVTFFVLN